MPVPPAADKFIQLSDCLNLHQVQFAGGIADASDGYSGFAQHRNQKVVHRRILRVTDVLSAFDIAVFAAGQHEGKIMMGMIVAIAQAAAEQQQ
jgi:hypothetical protein